MIAYFIASIYGNPSEMHETLLSNDTTHGTFARSAEECAATFDRIWPNGGVGKSYHGRPVELERAP